MIAQQVWRIHPSPPPSGLGETPVFIEGNWWRAGAGRAMWFGFGDAAGDLAAFDSSVMAGDTYFLNGEWQNAVVAYQAAGASGVITIGPEIDFQTNGASKPLTQQAWAINGNLSAVNSNGSTQSDAGSAQGFAKQMQNLYHQAIAAQAPAPSGQPSTALINATRALVDYLNTNGCTQQSFDACRAFQTVYNGEGSVILSVDGKYGNNSRDAVQRVLDILQSPPEAAPASCFGGGSSQSPVPGPVPGPGPVVRTKPATVVTSGSTNWTPWIIGGAAAAGVGVVGYAYWRKKHKRAR